MIFADVSFYQYRYVDFRLSAISRYIDFFKMQTISPAVIIRAGQNTWKDIAFDTSWRNAKQAGLIRGSYWFYDSRANPKRQAEKWVEVLGNDIGEAGLWCDFEDNYGGMYHGYNHWYDFIERVKQLLPTAKIGVYTGYYYWLENTPNLPDSFKKYFGSFPLWIAWYNVNEPKIPPIWNDWLIWQYTDNGDGEAWGVASGNIDLNRFNGNETDFINHFGTGTVLERMTLTASFKNKLVEYRNGL